ncbi:hypothetical protein IMZ48_11705, partial [Candidatus Bathyarchaeota archaeon]|nr:hypothetical protein [Candidatus Bathyarchaeota archaeon]
MLTPSSKHMRRHDKPYACTFPKCDSNFGSKSDWRRHENTQHFQLVVWKCDMPAEEGICRQACYRRDAFERHLLENHGILEGEGQEKAQERCRVDRSSSAKFWCGFCGDVVAVAPRESNGAWGERYDHIGNHFTGCNGFRKADRGEWKCGDVD